MNTTSKNSNTYVPVRVSTLRGDQKIPFDAHVLINNKHILLVRKGDSFEGSRLQKLKEKKLRCMYIHTDSELDYRSYIKNNLEIAYNSSSGKSIEDRSDIIQGVQESSVEDLVDNPESESAYQAAKDGIAQYIDFLFGEDKAFTTMLSIENDTYNLSQHGVSVATLAVALAHRLGIEEQAKKQLIMLGGFLHDYGLFNSSLDLSIHPSKYSKEDKILYERHPVIGVEKVVKHTHFDAIVLRIIKQHEEHIDGSGFPQKLRQTQIDPFSLIVGICNAFDTFIAFDRIPKEEAMKKLTIDKLGRYPLEHFQGLQAIYKDLKIQQK